MVKNIKIFQKLFSFEMRILKGIQISLNGAHRTFTSVSTKNSLGGSRTFDPPFKHQILEFSVVNQAWRIFVCSPVVFAGIFFIGLGV